MSAFQREHACHIDNIWHMDEGYFTRGCWDCLYGGSVWPVWARNVRVSDANRYRMELAMIKGYAVETDGSDFLVHVGDNVRMLSMVLDEYEWNSAREQHYE